MMSETSRKTGYTWKSLIILIAATLAAGGIVGFLTQQDSAFYEKLNKPAFAPPG